MHGRTARRSAAAAARRPRSSATRSSSKGLAKSDTFEAAFEKAKALVAERERDADYAPPAEPQMFVGDEMAAKIKALRKRGAAGLTAQKAPALRRG